ncbi:C40 family peptidase [Arenibacter amylolyticus]|uniref:C40 family peptidase n=1 Tax=Arenibacter amylolyticus TaxID=1406873 RepID=UPI000A3D0AFF|nr:TIGR02594 family protein [Arenibacter amylolyticus]
MKNLIEILSQEIGVKEIKGAKANTQILKYAKDCGFKEYTSDETAWCSLFANWVALQAGLERSKRLDARSWLNVGTPIDNPEPGDVVVFWRESRNSWKGHVGFYTGFSHDKQRVYCLGGNQGNQVSLSAYPAERILQFRRLRSVSVPNFSSRNIKIGDSGEDVAKLQDALKQLGYNCGTSDGIFGPMTERCLKDFQSSNKELQRNGVLDKATREYLVEIIKNRN